MSARIVRPLLIFLLSNILAARFHQATALQGPYFLQERSDER